MAWRNLWRNPRRTIITTFSMFFGLTMMIVTYALMDGMANQMVDYATLLGTGHVQVHHPDFLEERSLYYSIEGFTEVLEKIEVTGIGSASPRSYSTALLSSGSHSAGGLLWGIDPEMERNVTDLHRHVDRGSFLGPDDRGTVVLGKHLANTLGLEPGDELVVLSQAADGSLGNEIYIVGGVLKSVNEALDRGGVLVHREDLDALAVLNGKVHEIAIRLNNPEGVQTAAGELSAVLGPMGLQVKTWKELVPEIAEYMELSRSSTSIVLFIIFAAASLGIMNTQLMALFERTREIGVMRALGLGPFKVAFLILAETLFLTVLAAAIGGLAGTIWALHLEKHGWDITNLGGSFAFGGVTFDPFLHASLTHSAVIDSVGIMILVAFLATLYPLFLATRITPVDAIGRSR